MLKVTFPENYPYPGILPGNRITLIFDERARVFYYSSYLIPGPGGILKYRFTRQYCLRINGW